MLSQPNALLLYLGLLVVLFIVVIGIIVYAATRARRREKVQNASGKSDVDVGGNVSSKTGQGEQRP